MVDLTLPDPSPTPPSTQDSGDAAARLVARVQAWQHRHPLARRLPAADVNGLGVIALPFAGPAGAGGKLQPLFHQPSLVPGLSHRALVEFAQRHAVKYRPGPADWPLKEVERADASPDPAPETRYLLTAAITEPIKPGAQPRRLLIAPEGQAIWGPRPLSRRRVAEAVGVLVLILLALVWGQRGRLAAGGGAPATAPASPASIPQAARPASLPASMGASAGASTPTIASTPAPAPVAHGPVVPLPVAASAATVGPASVAARALPASAPAVAVSASSVAIPASAARPASSPAKAPSSPAAMVASAPAAPASVALPPPPKLLPMPALRGAAASAAAAAASAPASAASAVVSPAGPHFALVSLPSKKRAGAEETLARIHKLLGPAIGNLQAQIMPSPEGYVVTIWPLPTEADAEQLANVLARRGVPMKWLEF